MQDALGADSTDLNRSAQPSSNDLVTDNSLHSFPCISFTTSGSGDRATRIRGTACPVARLRAPLSRACLRGVIRRKAGNEQIAIAEI